jgi:pyruvate/2-oxoglutarate dehydrogenase complex dihydrolipoamide dehydrogenase (E3) component
MCPVQTVTYVSGRSLHSSRELNETACVLGYGEANFCVDAETKQILGAGILGTGGDEVIHVLLDVMYTKAPYTVIQRAMHIHPTVAEYLPTVLSKLEPFAGFR